jgi:hypothetical protein
LAVHAAIELDAHLLVALAGGGGLEIGNAFLEIGATIAAEIGGFGSFFHPGHAADGAENRRNCQPSRPAQSPDHDTPPFWLFECRPLKPGVLFVPDSRAPLVSLRRKATKRRSRLSLAFDRASVKAER